MNREIEYLSDESLEELIAMVEQRELVTAPPDLKECILGRVKASPQIQRNKKEEFRRYCIRVWTSVAAAVFLVFMSPAISGHMERQPEKESMLIQVLGGSNLFGNEDVFHFFREDGGR